MSDTAKIIALIKALGGGGNGGNANLTVDEDGNATINAVSFAVDENGNATI